MSSVVTSDDLAALHADHLQIQCARTDAALAASDFDALAIYAGRAPMQFLDDQPYPFKPNPHFRMWVPLSDAADSWIVYRPGQLPHLIFLRPVDYWHLSPTLPEEPWTKHFQITLISDAAQARSHIASLKRCAFIGPQQDEFTDWNFAARNPQPLLDRLHYPRAVKTAYEIECMRRASRLAARGHIAAENAFRAGASEYDIHNDYLRALRHTENELPYPSIVALNRHAAVLHYQHQQRTAPAMMQSLLIDAGAQVAGYASDVTRTHSFRDDEFSALVRGMHSLQQSLCDQVRPGVDYAQIHLDTHQRIAVLLRSSGIIKVPGEDAVASGLSGVFFPHGVGHLLGLQVHDVSGFTVSMDGRQQARPAGHPNLRLTRTLEPGFAVTIEPGLYFIDMLLDAARASPQASAIDWRTVDAFKRFGGIRIEDNVVCSSREPENLTRNAFSRLN